MQMQSVDAASIKVWRWQSVFFLCLQLVVVSMLATMMPLPGWLSVVMIVMALILLLIFPWWYPAAWYRHLSYGLDDTGINVARGIVWRTVSFLPRIRIQHTDVTQGPLQRRYGVATLALYTAGSRHTKIDLPGLAHDTALALRQELRPRNEQDAKGDEDDAD